jgi:hypothetical protein
VEYFSDQLKHCEIKQLLRVNFVMNGPIPCDQDVASIGAGRRRKTPLRSFTFTSVRGVDNALRNVILAFMDVNIVNARFAM